MTIIIDDVGSAVLWLVKGAMIKFFNFVCL